MARHAKSCFLFLLVALLFTGCAHYVRIDTAHKPAAYMAGDDSALDGQQSDRELLRRFCPVFVTPNPETPFNRIGTPEALLDKEGNEEISINPDRPAIYAMVRRFETPKDHYTNLIYRVHFSEVPASLMPFLLTAGKNVGLLTIVTLDSKEDPVLVTTVNTCGCYFTQTPTDFLPEDRLPEDWKREPHDYYGEELPWRLNMAGMKKPGVMVRVRPGVHRVMELAAVDRTAGKSEGCSLFSEVKTPLIPMESLWALPIDGGTTSFYELSGKRKGFVKGSIKRWETLLMGWFAWDPYVGSDKAYADTEKTGNPFYTSLRPWLREESNLWYFDRVLQFKGWRF